MTMTEKILAMVTARGNVSFAEFNREINKLKCARLRGACGRWRCRCRLINRLINRLRGQILHRHAVTALQVVLNPHANGVADIVRKPCQVAPFVMDYHFAGIPIDRIPDVNKQVRNLLSSSIHHHKVGRACNWFRGDYEYSIGLTGSRLCDCSIARDNGCEWPRRLKSYRKTRRHFDNVSRPQLLHSNVLRGRGQPGAVAGQRPKPRSTIEPQDRSTRISSSFALTAPALKVHSVVGPRIRQYWSMRKGENCKQCCGPATHPAWALL